MVLACDDAHVIDEVVIQLLVYFEGDVLVRSRQPRG